MFGSLSHSYKNFARDQQKECTAGGRLDEPLTCLEIYGDKNVGAISLTKPLVPFMLCIPKTPKPSTEWGEKNERYAPHSEICSPRHALALKFGQNDIIMYSYFGQFLVANLKKVTLCTREFFFAKLLELSSSSSFQVYARVNNSQQSQIPFTIFQTSGKTTIAGKFRCIRVILLSHMRK